MNTLQTKNRQQSAMVYVDYENILQLLNFYGKDPLGIDFFTEIQGRLVRAGLTIMDFIVYGDFEKKPINRGSQILLQVMGLQTRHACNDGKNSGDLELTVDVLKDLYRNPTIDIFVIISSNRDIIPLLKAIKYENKFSYIYSTQNGFNQIVAKYADFHEYIEEIFDFTPPEPEANPWDGLYNVDPEAVRTEDIQQAREVADYLYHSHIWAKSSILGKPVILKGYLDVIARIVKRSPENIFNDFKLAHSLKFITIYRDPERGLCLKEGERMGRVSEVFYDNNKCVLTGLV